MTAPAPRLMTSPGRRLPPGPEADGYRASPETAPTMADRNRS